MRDLAMAHLWGGVTGLISGVGVALCVCSCIFFPGRSFLRFSFQCSRTSMPSIDLLDAETA